MEWGIGMVVWMKSVREVKTCSGRSQMCYPHSVGKARPSLAFKSTMLSKVSYMHNHHPQPCSIPFCWRKKMQQCSVTRFSSSWNFVVLESSKNLGVSINSKSKKMIRRDDSFQQCLSTKEVEPLYGFTGCVIIPWSQVKTVFNAL